MTIILGIESTCDETSIGILDDNGTILSNVVASSMDEHAVYGGVVPEIAARAHLESIKGVLVKALNDASVDLADIDAIAVANKPGLIGSLTVGVSTANALSFALKKPIYYVDHILAHAFSAELEYDISDLSSGKPVLSLVVSGGHSSIFLIEGSFSKLIGHSIDDAPGEAFDKIGKLLGLTYPGGPKVDKLAREGEIKYVFPKGLTQNNAVQKHPYDFSFSGVKTAVLYKINELKRENGEISEKMIKDICASFSESVSSVLVEKTLKAAKDFFAGTILVGGGFACNSQLRDKFSKCDKKIFIAPTKYCTDNGIMIANLAMRMHKKNIRV